MPIDVDRLIQVYQFLSGFLDESKKNDGASLQLSDGRTTLTRNVGGPGSGPDSGGDVVDPNRAIPIAGYDQDLLLGIEKPEGKLAGLPAFPPTSGSGIPRRQRTPEEIEAIFNQLGEPEEYPDPSNTSDLRTRLEDLITRTPADDVPLSRNRSSGQIDTFSENENSEGSIINLDERKQEEENKGKTFAKRKTRRMTSNSGKNRRQSRRSNRK